MNKDLPEYILLTGGKNNCGDFLIKHRAKELLKQLRPDRSFQDWDAWHQITDDDLEVINNSKALVLTGGPAIQTQMYPLVYPLTDNLSKIKVPIICFGLGAKPNSTILELGHSHKLSNRTLDLLDRINQSGHISSVRDYVTARLLEKYGFYNFTTTGCPALYSLTNQSNQTTPDIRRITFSTSANFAHDKNLESQMKRIILSLSEIAGTTLNVAFHHSLDSTYLNTHNANSKLFYKQRELKEWLDRINVPCIDISGSVDNMLDLYSQTDIHVGYRVHAHILMCSWAKDSILIAEDGRSTALKEVISSEILNAYEYKHFSISKKLERLTGSFITLRKVSSMVPERICKTVKQIIDKNHHESKRVSALINTQLNVMKDFIRQMP
ncbi:polysaccharide pyruvyl transferase family protein [Hahella sp. CCB-MM4]|uniref:polysaccharide pyruvyl transferase family protein n=1 Tax=Hahella sp. (strain CCB-MM4) TaxID=1926491 RepID=UPI00113FCF66|nr:polysaccharide pyruvyl transferase family protein [Hahella sp. CCB-MM4]